MHRRDVYVPNVRPEALREVHDDALKKLTGATPAEPGESRSRAVARLLDYGGLPVDMLMLVLGPSVMNRHSLFFVEGHHFSGLVKEGGIALDDHGDIFVQTAYYNAKPLNWSF